MTFPTMPATACRGAAAITCRDAANPIYPLDNPDFRSTEMYAMNEAIARERIASLCERAHRSRAANEMAAASRWHRVEIRARAARQRHAARAECASAKWAMASAQRR